MLPFKHSFTSLVSGPTGYGKTIFVMRLIDNVVALIELTPDKIVYYFAEYQATSRSSIDIRAKGSPTHS